MTAHDGSRGPTGRRGEVRQRLITAAREQFTTKEFTEVTLRDIASAAHCDPGLINYYFGSKVGIFREAMSLPSDPVRIIMEAFGEGGLGTGERVVNAVLSLWEDSKAQQYIHVFAGSLLSSAATFDVFSSWVEDWLIKPLASKLDAPDAMLRLEIALGEVLGLCSARYVFGRRPLATRPKEEVARIFGPSLDITLYGRHPDPKA